MTDIERRKRVLRGRIASHRVQTGQAAAPLIEVAAWVDVARLVGRKLSLMAQLSRVPVGASVAASIFARGRWSRKLHRWLPVIVAAARLLKMWRGRSKVGERHLSGRRGSIQPRNARPLSQSAEHVATR
jgi:hypothetical protein